jgi:hypothetical protein
VRETTDSSDPSGRPAELPWSTENEPPAGGNRDRPGSQAAARMEAEAAYRAEFAKAMSGQPDMDSALPDSTEHQVRYVDGHDATPAEVESYDRIRKDVGDTARISVNTGIPQEKLDQIKSHVFYEQHDLAMAPGQIDRANFTPDGYIAKRWSKAAEGTLNPGEAEEFHRLMAHEYVELKLMDHGIPYRSAHPDSWSPELGNHPTRDHFGAHDLAPLARTDKEPFFHWERALGREGPEMEIAPDLSNLDDVVEQILRKV